MEMDSKVFGSTGFKVSPFGLGTYYDPAWLISAKFFGFRNRKDLHIAAIRSGLEAGVNMIDTAELYGSEELVANAIEGFDREKLFIASKVFPTHLRYDSVKKACEKSIRRLKCKYLDLYQIHFPSRRIPIGETMKAMEDLVDEGKIRFIGISNFSLERTIEAEKVMKKNRVVSTQMPYSMIDRKIENGLLQHCVENDIAVLAYYPLGHGKLGSDNSEVSNSIEKISQKHGGKTLAQIALNWFYSKHQNVFPIPRASNPDHVKENLGSVGWSLDPADLSELDRIISKL